MKLREAAVTEPETATPLRHPGGGDHRRGQQNDKEFNDLAHAVRNEAARLNRA
jgi:hypothetical protein